MSPVGQFLPLERFGAVTTRTMTFEPREGHFTTRTDWRVRDWPGLLRRYSGALRQIDARLDERLRLVEHRRRSLLPGLPPADGRAQPDRLARRLLRRGVQPPRRLRERARRAGEIAAVELNVSCHNVNFGFDEIIDEVLTRGRPHEPAPGHPQALARLRLPRDRAACRGARCRGAHRGQHGQGPAPRPGDRASRS